MGQALKTRILEKIRFCGGGFGDIFPILDDPELRRQIVMQFNLWMIEELRDAQHIRIDRIAGIETRGAILAAIVAHNLNLPFSIIRHEGKLHEDLRPLRRNFVDYTRKQKGLEVSPEHFREGENVLVIDDWFETGQSARAAAQLIEQCGGRVVGFATIVNAASLYPDAQEFIARQPFLALVDL